MKAGLVSAADAITAAGVIGALAYATLSKINPDFGALIAIFVSAVVATTIAQAKAKSTKTLTE